MTNEIVANQLLEFITANFLFGSADKPIFPDDSFMNSGIIDSTGVLELVSFIEETYGIKVGDHEILPENLDSLNRLTAFVRRKTSA